MADRRLTLLAEKQEREGAQRTSNEDLAMSFERLEKGIGSNMRVNEFDRAMMTSSA